MPGYFSTIALMPEIKTGTCSTLSWPYATHVALFFSVSLTLWLASSFDPSKHRFPLVHCCAGGAFASHGTDPVGASATPRQPGQSHGLCRDLPSFSLWRVTTPLPPHLSRPHTCTLRSGNNRVMQGNVTVQADLDTNTLNMSFAITGTALPGPSVGVEFSWLSPCWCWQVWGVCSPWAIPRLCGRRATRSAPWVRHPAGVWTLKQGEPTPWFTSR